MGYFLAVSPDSLVKRFLGQEILIYYYSLTDSEDFLVNLLVSLIERRAIVEPCCGFHR